MNEANCSRPFRNASRPAQAAREPHVLGQAMRIHARQYTPHMCLPRWRALEEATAARGDLLFAFEPYPERLELSEDFATAHCAHGKRLLVVLESNSCQRHRAADSTKHSLARTKAHSVPELQGN